MKDDSFDCTLIAHLRIFLLFYRLLYCLILPENRLFFGIWKVVEIDVVAVKGVKNMLIGGEGIFNTVVKGPGKVILQTMPISKVAELLTPFFADKK